MPMEVIVMPMSQGHAHMAAAIWVSVFSRRSRHGALSPMRGDETPPTTSSKQRVP